MSKGLLFSFLLSIGVIVFSSFSIYAGKGDLPSLDKDINNNSLSVRKSKGITSETLPEKYSLERERTSEFILDLTHIKSKYPISPLLEQKWEFSNLLRHNAFLFYGAHFLEYNAGDFANKFSNFFGKIPSPLAEEKMYFSTLWDKILMSASLLSGAAPFGVGEYGLILDVPPELILRTYTIDAVTSGGAILGGLHNNQEAINQYLDNYIMNGAPASGQPPHEYDLKYTLIDTDKLIDITAQNRSHNEIYFSPRAISRGIKKSVSIRGIYIDDEAFSKEFSLPEGWPKDEPFPGQPKYSKAIKMEKLRAIARDLNIPIIFKSQLISNPYYLVETFNGDIEKGLKPINDFILIEKYKNILQAITTLRSIINNIEAHPLDSTKPMDQLTQEDFEKARSVYQNELQELLSKLQTEVGDTASAEKLIILYQLRERIEQLKVFIKHVEAHPLDSTKPMDQLTQEDFEKARSVYQNELDALEQKVEELIINS